MRCALATRNYLPRDFSEVFQEKYQLNVYTAHDPPVLEKGEWKRCVISTGYTYKKELYAHFFTQNEPGFDPRMSAWLLAFRSYLQYRLEYLFQHDVHTMLTFEPVGNTNTELVSYEIRFKDCDLYVHPDAEELFNHHLVNPSRNIQQGMCLVRSDMLEGEQYWVDGLLQKFAQLHPDVFILKQSPRNLHLFFRAMDIAEEDIISMWTDRLLACKKNLERIGWHPLTTPEGKRKGFTATPDGYYAPS